MAEKLALERLGMGCWQREQPARALGYFHAGADRAEAVGDRSQQAIVLWQVAVVHADIGQRGEALAAGERAVELFQAADRVQAQVYVDHLERYRAGGGRIATDPRPVTPIAPGRTPARAPNPLRMAISAATAFSIN